MTTTESSITPSTAVRSTPLPGIELDDPVRVAETLRDEFRPGAAERDRERVFPYEQCASFRASGLLGLIPPANTGGMGAPSRSS